jgi:hypothetical protein
LFIGSAATRIAKRGKTRQKANKRRKMVEKVADCSSLDLADFLQVACRPQDLIRSFKWLLTEGLSASCWRWTKSAVWNSSQWLLMPSDALRLLGRRNPLSVSNRASISIANAAAAILSDKIHGVAVYLM